MSYDDKPIFKPNPQNKTYEVNKNMGWKNGKLRPNRVSGRPKTEDKPENQGLVETSRRSQIAIYNKIVNYMDKIDENISYFLTHKNDKLRLDATVLLLDKILPNAKAQEIAERNAPVQINFVSKGGFVPPDSPYASSVGGSERPTPLQGSSMASAGEEDNHVNHRSRKAGIVEEGSILAPVSDIRGS